MAFFFAQKVLFKHCDPAGIVFYPRYFEMINDCVETFFDTALGFAFEDIHTHSAVPTAEISSRFLAPSRHGDHLEIRLDCRRIGNSSLALEITARCGDEARFAASATLVHVGLDGRPTAWPDGLRRALEDFKKDMTR